MFWHRFASMIVLLGLLGLTLWNSFPGKMAYLVFGTFLVVFMIRELADMLKNIDIIIREKSVRWISFLFFILFAFIFLDIEEYAKEILLFFSDSEIEKFAVYFIIILLPAVILYYSILLVKSVNSPEKLKSIVGSIFVNIFVVIPVLLITLIYSAGTQKNYDTQNFNALFLFFILVTKSGDIGAYIVGSLSGKILPGGNHKLIPQVSPGKSFEGVIGGLLFSIGISYLINHFFGIFEGEYAISFVILFGAVLYCSGMYGDLVESSIKRTCKVKDSGKTIPGIGGIYDLLDSLFLAAPFMYALIKVCDLPFKRCLSLW